MKPLAVKIGQGVLIIRLWPTLTTAIMFLGLLGLGTWQVQRLHWKENLIATITARLKEVPVDASTITNPPDNEYRPITASGSAAFGQELYMHAISLAGEAGYHVLIPLSLSNGNYLLVDRGFVPFDKKEPETRSDGVLIGATSLKGLLRLPHHHWMQPKDYPEQNDWYGYDLPAMADHLGLPDFLPFVLEADAAPNPGGYPIGGQTRVDLPNNHLVYAVIWFSLALALLIIYGVSSWKPPKRD